MQIYLLKEYFRIDCMTGNPIEQEFSDDFIKYENSMELECGRNQYVSFQIAFDSEGEEITKADVEFSDLKGENYSICKEEYSIYIEWFHKMDGRYVPDALIPIEWNTAKFRVPQDEKYLKGQRVGVLWVDLFIPGDAPPGEYCGKLAVSAGALDKRVFDIRVKVHGVTLEPRSRICADLNSYADSVSCAFPSLRANRDRYVDGSYFEVEKEFYRLAYDHRCTWHHLPYTHSGTIPQSFAPEVEGEGKNIRVKSWELFDRHYSGYYDGSAFKGSKWGGHPVLYSYLPFNITWPASYEKWGKKGYAIEFRRILREFTRHFEEMGWKETYFELFFNHKKIYRFFPYDGDETRFLDDSEFMDIFGALSKEAFEDTDVKFIFRTDSSWSYGHHYDSKYSDMVKMWVVNKCIFSWFPESVPVMKKKGNILFYYTGLDRLDANLMSLVSKPLECIMMGTDGFTLWNVQGFGEDYLATPLDNGRQAIWYPGHEFGYDKPIPSIRLKVLRNCMQLVDMIKAVEATPLMRKAKDIINRNYGYDDTSWWKEKPEFINDPPHTWTNAKLSDANPSINHVGSSLSPVVLDKIRSEILDVLSVEGF